MHPELFKIGPLTVHFYGTLIVVGFLAALGLIKLRVKHYGIPFDKAVDLMFGLLIWGFVGAKIFQWIIIPSEFLADIQLLFTHPVNFVKNLGNGFEFFGGIFTGVIYFTWFCRKHSLNYTKTLDLLAPAIPFAHAFGRIGCFMAGCCFGKPNSSCCAVVFTDPKSLAPLHVPLHPTQLYESVLLFVLTAFLLLEEKRLTRVSGRMISIYILGYTVIRFFVEYFRADNRGIIPGVNLSGTQVISLIVAAGAIVWLRKVHHHHSKVVKEAESQ